MKISNFRYLGCSEGSVLGATYYASITVTTGFLFFKKETEVVVYRRYSEHWNFIENGEYTQGNDVEKLCSAFQARAGQSISGMGIKYQKEGIKVISDTDK